MGSRKTVQMNRSAGQQWRAGTGNRLRAQEGQGGARRGGEGRGGWGKKTGRMETAAWKQVPAVEQRPVGVC